MIRTVVITLFILSSIYDFFLIYLNLCSSSRPLPQNVRDVYDEKEYKKYLSYKKECGKIDLYSLVFSSVVNLVLLIGNVYALLFKAFDNMNVYMQYFLVILILNSLSTILKLPFSIYSTFVIEEKYEKNRTTKKTFFFDTIKTLILSILLTFILVSIIVFFFSRYGIRGVIGTSIALITIILILNTLVMPLLRLFNKFIPLENGELKEKLLSLCRENNITVKRIVVRDASRRTTSSNAFCTGLGKKTIALDDNLIKRFSTDEIVAVFAHEAGHAKKKHLIKSLPISILSSILMILAFGLLLEFIALFTQFGFTSINYLFAFTLLEIIFRPFEIISGIITNYISRRHEYEADGVATRSGYGESLISALKKLHKEALGEINPPKWIVITEYSHPTLSERINAIEMTKK